MYACVFICFFKIKLKKILCITIFLRSRFTCGVLAFIFILEFWIIFLYSCHFLWEYFFILLPPPRRLVVIPENVRNHFFVNNL